MTTIEIRSLLKEKKRVIPIPKEVQEVFDVWKEKRGEDFEPLEAFYAGYVLSNPIVRELYKKELPSKEETFNPAYN
jgi:hypothetical protein